MTPLILSLGLGVIRLAEAGFLVARWWGRRVLVAGN